ncbi:hypothetical protein B0H14DRAFT_3437800 [Mycena olivaceomarginata]|nr:hypothetical protein B0H14DRAFT_3437800 [Mycena olivaceomarginata]
MFIVIILLRTALFCAFKYHSSYCHFAVRIPGLSPQLDPVYHALAFKFHPRLRARLSPIRPTEIDRIHRGTLNKASFSASSSLFSRLTFMGVPALATAFSPLKATTTLQRRLNFQLSKRMVKNTVHADPDEIAVMLDLFANKPLNNSDVLKLIRRCGRCRKIYLSRFLPAHMAVCDAYVYEGA